MDGIDHKRKHGLGSLLDHTPATLAELNALVSDATLVDGAAVADVSCSAYRSSNYLVTKNTETAIPLNAEDYDTDTMHDNSTNPSRITIPTGKGGKYLIIGLITWDSEASGIRRITITKNGAPGVGTTIELYQCNPVGSNETPVRASKVVELVAGDYIEMYGYTSSGGDINAMAGTEKTFLQAIAQRGVS